MILDFERPICAMGRSGKAVVAFLGGQSMEEYLASSILLAPNA